MVCAGFGTKPTWLGLLPQRRMKMPRLVQETLGRRDFEAEYRQTETHSGCLFLEKQLVHNQLKQALRQNYKEQKQKQSPVKQRGKKHSRH